MAAIICELLLPVLDPIERDEANAEGFDGALSHQMCRDLTAPSSSPASSSSAPVAGVGVGRRRLRAKVSCESPLSLPGDSAGGLCCSTPASSSGSRCDGAPGPVGAAQQPAEEGVQEDHVVVQGRRFSRNVHKQAWDRIRGQYVSNRMAAMVQEGTSVEKGARFALRKQFQLDFSQLPAEKKRSLRCKHGPWQKRRTSVRSCWRASFKRQRALLCLEASSWTDDS